jgi:SAM-dependent methyltransferase
MLNSQTPGPDPFYVEVLRSALRAGAVKADDEILVVCGGPRDEVSLREAGCQRVTTSNIGGDQAVDVENLPYPAESFDCVIVHSGLHHCASPHRGLLEMYRVARRCVILFEPADNWLTWLGKKLGIGQEFEFSAVIDHNYENSGWRNTSIPNWVYRFTASEIRQTICANAPFGPHAFHFFYRTRIPWPQLRRRKSKLPLLLAGMSYPFLRLLDWLGPLTSNNLAAVIAKPRLPDQMYPWLEESVGLFRARRDWFANAGKR